MFLFQYIYAFNSKSAFIAVVDWFFLETVMIDCFDYLDRAMSSLISSSMDKGLQKVERIVDN